MSEEYLGWPEAKLVLAATPIGNWSDASSRLIYCLQNADIIAAEDTRRALALLRGLGVKTEAKVLSCFEHNESQRIPTLLAAVRQGQKVLLISDAGMPTVSDPGYQLVQSAIAEGIAFTVLPGPSAVLTALAMSGLPTDRFAFEGFLPRKPGAIRKQLNELKNFDHTMVFFESPHRLAATLTIMAEVFGEQHRGAVCRELTKTFEEVWRGTLAELLLKAENVRGEIVIVLEGAKSPQLSLESALVEVDSLVTSGERLKNAVKLVAAKTDFSAKSLYDEAVNKK